MSQRGDFMSTAFEESVTSTNPPPPAPSMLERLLSPQGIHTLLGTGGGLFVIGVIVWLATLGIFDHPLVLASALAAGNLAFLAAGYWLVLSSRFQLAGLALTLLACLLMPLHLWFYHSQHLLTFDNHLWAAALIISLLYALTARILQNVWFVPIFLGGIALTSLLILADLGQFWQITAPAMTLMALGLAAIHAERLFSQDASSPFRRERFGLAFFWSGHVLLGLGLLMVLAAQLAGGPLYESNARALYESWHVTRTDLVTTQTGKLTALLLVLAGVYAHLYSDLIVRRKGYYLQAAAILVIWIEFIVIDLLNIELQKETILGVFAATGLLLQLLHHYLGNRLPAARTILPFIASFLILGAGIAGMFFYVIAALPYLHREWVMASISPVPLLMSIIITFAACFAGLVTSVEKQYTGLYRSAVAMTSLLVAALAIAIFAPASWYSQAGFNFILAIAAIGFAWKLPVVRELGHFSHIFLALWLMLGLPQLVQLGTPQSLTVVMLLMLAATAYLLSALLLNQKSSVIGTLLCAILVGVHLFSWLDFALAYKLAAGSAVGAALMILAYSISRKSQPIGAVLNRAGQGIFFLSILASILFGIQSLGSSRLLNQHVWPIFNTLLFEAALCWFFYWSRKGTTNLYFACAITNVILAGILMVTLLELPQWRKLELASIGLGIGLTIFGFRAWAMEVNDKQRQAAISPLFLLGVLLIGIPLALVVTGYRSAGQFMLLDEASMFILGLLLLLAGCVCQLRIPAIAGAALTVLYLLGLLLFVPWGHLGTASLVLAGGGASLFLVGLALSIFRDRLLALPTQVRERRGIFQVLGWR